MSADRPHGDGRDALDAACVAEVEALHAVFEDWFAGRLAADGFARVEQALGEGFVLVGPDGAATGREALLASLRAAGGSRPDGSLRMSVHGFDVQTVDDDLRLVRYVEQHHAPPHDTRRLSSALLRRDAAAPGGVRWLTVHETWIAGHGPAGD